MFRVDADVGCRGASSPRDKTDSGLLMDPPFGCSLFLGPCAMITGTGHGGRPSKSKGCGWLVDSEWGRKFGIQFNTASTHSCTITIQSQQREIDLVSLYSALLSLHVWHISILEALGCLTRASPNSIWTWLWPGVPACPNTDCSRVKARG